MRLVASSFRPGASASRVAERRRRGQHLLEVVEHEQELLVAQVLDQRLERALARLLAQAERLRDRRHDELRLADRRELDEGRAVREPLAHAGGELEREPGLAGAAGADQRQQAHVVAREQLAGLGELALAPDEGVRHRGEAREPVVERVQRRELVRQAVDLELVELLRAGQVLQHVLAEVAELDARPEQRARGLRDEHLAAVAGRHHARRVVHVEADVAAVHPPRLAGVQAHAHADLVAVGPVVPGERALAVHGRRGGVGGRLERDEEPVALGPEHRGRRGARTPRAGACGGAPAARGRRRRSGAGAGSSPRCR